MFSYFRRKKERGTLNRLAEDGLFFYKTRGACIAIDPLVAYIRLKEIGIDVMFDYLKGALAGKAPELREFTTNVLDIFKADEYDVQTFTGLTIVEAVRMFSAYMRYLEYLKKNVTFLRDFAPDITEQFNAILSGSAKDKDLQAENSSSG